jgi:hypothetical protein
MSAQQIQAFLEVRVPICDTFGTKPSEFGGGTRAQWAAARGYSPPFTCLKDFSENGKSASQIIYDVAQQFSINPQVLIVLLQKEQSLITDDWPIPGSAQYRTATGYGCPDTAACDSQYYGLTNQLTWSGRMFRSIINASPTWFTPYVLGNNYIQFNPTASCGGSVVNIQNRATQALYNYTPYQPNQAALDAGWGSVSCGAYGNRNFYLYFVSWFGSPYSFVVDGVSYAPVFDPAYYVNTYPDLRAAFGENQILLFNHFIGAGISEGRQGNATFNINSYRTRYDDLRNTYGGSLQRYLWHYATTGINEGRIATGDARGGTTVLNGVNYAAAYNFDYYTRNNPDVWAAYGLNDQRTLWHFVNVGVYEGRQGNATFNITAYRTRYLDLRNAYGTVAPRYVWHFVTTGVNEGRITL